MAEKKPAEGEPIVIKKYANRRLYNTATSSYVTLDYLSQMVKDGDEFVVNDAKTGEDITRQVLTHIIVEEESKGTNLLPISFLRHLISFYGDSLQTVVPNYLEHTMQSFATNQEALRKTMEDALGGFNPFGQFEEVSKQNMALFENAMKMFSPFPMPNQPTGTPQGGAAEKGGAAPKGAGAPKSEADIDDMRAKLAEMQRQLDTLSSDKK
ncbi:MAG: polyhydroxyalkanoate synthesis repressor PhaR [Rhodospirillaceae bacterium]|nr:polyhydroxyalkanoate synthesis repressor PhaR [Magnetovibrio sp.]MAY67079.1 polyhydroxyalkanoate synthesis repressor PhaR [Rhodospirillaceae bacterium]